MFILIFFSSLTHFIYHVFTHRPENNFRKSTVWILEIKVSPGLETSTPYSLNLTCPLPKPFDLIKQAVVGRKYIIKHTVRAR